ARKNSRSGSRMSGFSGGINGGQFNNRPCRYKSILPRLPFNSKLAVEDGEPRIPACPQQRPTQDERRGQGNDRCPALEARVVEDSQTCPTRQFFARIEFRRLLRLATP